MAREYSPEMKTLILEDTANLNAGDLEAWAMHNGTAVSTIYRWRRQTEAGEMVDGRLVGSKSTNGVKRRFKGRKSYTRSERDAIVEDCMDFGREELEQYCKRHDYNKSTVRNWVRKKRKYGSAILTEGVAPAPSPARQKSECAASRPIEGLDLLDAWLGAGRRLIIKLADDLAEEKAEALAEQKMRSMFDELVAKR